MLWRCNINFIFLKIKFIVYLFYWSLILGSVLARSMFRGSVFRVRASEGILGSCVSSINTFFLTWNKTYDLFFFRDHPVFQVCSVEQPSNSVSRIHEYINFLPLLCHWFVFDLVLDDYYLLLKKAFACQCLCDDSKIPHTQKKCQEWKTSAFFNFFILFLFYYEQSLTHRATVGGMDGHRKGRRWYLWFVPFQFIVLYIYEVPVFSYPLCWWRGRSQIPSVATVCLGETWCDTFLVCLLFFTPFFAFVVGAFGRWCSISLRPL